MVQDRDGVPMLSELTEEQRGLRSSQEKPCAWLLVSAALPDFSEKSKFVVEYNIDIFQLRRCLTWQFKMSKTISGPIKLL